MCGDACNVHARRKYTHSTGILERTLYLVQERTLRASRHHKTCAQVNGCLGTRALCPSALCFMTKKGNFVLGSFIPAFSWGFKRRQCLRNIRRPETRRLKLWGGVTNSTWLHQYGCTVDDGYICLIASIFVQHISTSRARHLGRDRL